MIKHPRFLTRSGLRPFVIGLFVLVVAGICFSKSTISLSTASGPPTITLKVSGNGFAPHSKVDVYFDVCDQSEAVTDGSGSFSRIAIQAPASALPGKHWVSAVERSSGVSSRASFTVQSDWAEFHKQNMMRWNGVETVLKVRNVGRLEEKWTTYTGGGVYTAPAVANGVVYVGSSNSFYALDSTTGVTLWTFPVGSLYSSPAVVGGVVYFGANAPGNAVYALDASSGTLLWTYAMGDEVESPPTVVNGVVYIGGPKGNVYALNAKTGSVQWISATGADSGPFSSPAVLNGLVYLGSGNNVYALNTNTGVLKWKYATGDLVVSSPAVANGVVYIGSYDRSLYALNAKTGAKLWSYSTGDIVWSSPAVANGTVYVGSGDSSVYALNASTGALRWSYLTPKGGIYSSPAVANGVVYVSIFGGVFGDNNIYALNATTGAKLWGYSSGAVFSSSPVVANGMVYVGSDIGDLYAFSLKGSPKIASGYCKVPNLGGSAPKP